MVRVGRRAGPEADHHSVGMALGGAGSGGQGFLRGDPSKTFGVLGQGCGGRAGCGENRQAG